MICSTHILYQKRRAVDNGVGDTNADFRLIILNKIKRAGAPAKCAGLPRMGPRRKNEFWSALGYRTPLLKNEIKESSGTPPCQEDAVTLVSARFGR